MTTPYTTTSGHLVNDPRDSLAEFKGATNTIIETLIDGVRGFETAAESADGPLATKLTGMGTERRATTDSLISVAADLDMDPITLDDSGTPTGALHRAWMSLRESVQGDDGVVAAALNGEQHAKEEISGLLDGGLPDAVENIVRSALDEIDSNIEQLQQISS